MEEHEYTEEEKQRFKNSPEVLRDMRKDTEKGLSTIFPLFIKDSMAQDQATVEMKKQMRKKINKDDLADRLIPDFAVGCRRLTVCH